jgi:predicted nucleic acid-binding protein
MMLLDSNIIIYAAQPAHAALRQLINQNMPAVSAISYVEVLGYHQLTEPERQYYETFFAASPLLPLSQQILDQAVRLRQAKKMALGDALIAGTALIHNLTLVTCNIRDFEWIAELKLLNPINTQVAPAG